MQPLLTISKDQRSPGGTLSVRHIDIAANILSKMGYVMLPSDTGYSLAAVASDSQLHDRLNRILHRPGNWPISLAFSSVRAARAWITPNIVVDHLMEQFCPGPLTIVCQARSPVPAKFFDQAIASRNGTVGVRIPDSVVERDLAGCTGYPISTTAVREGGDGPIVTDFQRALALVSDGIDALPGTRWCAIEGEIVYGAHSTVIRVTKSGLLELIRDGVIGFGEIQRSVAALPATAIGDGPVL